MKLLPEERGGATVIRVAEPRIDAACAIQFKDGMRKVLETAGNRIVLDLGEVEFVDSSGLGAMVAVMKGLPDDCRLDLAGLTPTVAKVFSLTRLDSVFPIHADADAALGA